MSNDIEFSSLSDHEEIDEQTDNEELESDETDGQTSDEKLEPDEEDSEKSDLENKENDKLDFQLVLPRHLTCIDHSLELVMKKVIDNDCNSNAIGITLRNLRKLISSVNDLIIFYIFKHF